MSRGGPRRSACDARCYCPADLAADRRPDLDPDHTCSRARIHARAAAPRARRSAVRDGARVWRQPRGLARDALRAVRAVRALSQLAGDSRVADGGVASRMRSDAILLVDDDPAIALSLALLL